MKKSLLTLFCAVVLLSGCSYSRNLKVLTRQQATKDLDYLVESIETISYKPFSRVTKEDFDYCVERMKSGFGEQVSRKGLSTSIMELLAMLRDDHTNLGSFPDFIEYVKSGGKVLPLQLMYKDGDFIIMNVENANEPGVLKTDVRLVEIDDKPLNSFIERYRRYVSANTDYFKDILIAMRFGMYLWYFEEHRDSFRIKMEDEQGLSHTKMVEAVSADIEIKRKKPRAKNMFAYQFYKSNSVCFFRALSFNSLNEDLTENIWVRKRLIKILNNLTSDMKKRKSSILIVDIRNNGGGDTYYGVELLKRTSSRSFKKPRRHIRNSRAARKAYIINGLEKNRIPAFLHLENIIDFNLYGLKAKDFEIEGQYWYGRQQLIEPFDDSWNGTLVVLVNGLTGSAASEFAGIVKDNQLGLIVGKETGGRASFYGGSVPLILPNSGLICYLSTERVTRPGGFDDGRGVLPDFELDVTLEDDVLVEKIYNHIMIEPPN